MKAGVDLWGRVPVAAWREGSTTRTAFYDTPEQLLAALREKKLKPVVAVPLKSLEIQIHTSEAPASEEEELLLAESLLNQKNVLIMRSRPDAPGVKVLIGARSGPWKITPEAKATPRFLALLTGLEINEGVLVYRENDLWLLAVNQGYHLHNVKVLTIIDPSNLVLEVERFLRYAESAGIAKVVYAPEEEAELLASLAQSAEIQLYESEEEAVALGALLHGEQNRFLFVNREEEKARSKKQAESRTALVLTLLGLGMALYGLAVPVFLANKTASLRPRFEEAKQITETHKRLKEEVTAKQERLSLWEDYLRQNKTASLLSLSRAATEAAASTNSRLRQLTVTASQGEPKLEVEGLAKNSAADFLEALRKNGILILENYSEEGRMRASLRVKNPGP